MKTNKQSERKEIIETLLRAPPEKREQLYKQFYEKDHAKFEAAPFKLPSRRRQGRIATYRNVIGNDPRTILELGCAVGDLTYGLARGGRTVIGSDISSEALRLAAKRKPIWNLPPNVSSGVAFLQMNATELAFPSESFDCVVSTSMIEHLHPEDIRPHLREVCRVLRPGGRYLVWCPNRLGHHGDRDGHLSMLSHRELMTEMGETGFSGFQSLMFNRYPLFIDARAKAFLEDLFVRLGIRILWSHLGIRNILMLARKGPAQTK